MKYLCVKFIMRILNTLIVNTFKYGYKRITQYTQQLILL